LSGSLPVSAQTEPQSLRPDAQLIGVGPQPGSPGRHSWIAEPCTQVASKHISRAPHAWPQRPQFITLVRASTQVPPHESSLLLAHAGEETEAGPSAHEDPSASVMRLKRLKRRSITGAPPDAPKRSPPCPRAVAIGVG